ncbi:ABC transporter permease subunit [Spiroplasma endosymbiont of 'Nebria riversi']|uniref:ABC transporter permease subunit n=1 Tax=Spiroplasma endosymbiont of 'Nebria riversi' TaxID=2792084 RepID=UPI001C03AA81|nr:hypothetical protein [Spiroplasma endosymbiont of 'Nebria riversi']
MNIVNIFISSLSLSAPLLFAAMGCLIMQKAGILNFGVDGVMILGQLSYAIVVKQYLFLGDNICFLGFFLAFVIGMGLGLIHSVLTVSLKTNQFLVSFIWNYLALGLSSLILIFNYGQRTLDANEIFIAPIFIGYPLSLVFIFNVILILVVSSFFFLTRMGLYFKAAGKNAVVLTLSQINVVKIRYLAVIVGFGLIALGGAFFTNQKGTFDVSVDNIGLIAFAIVALSQWALFRSVFFTYLVTVLLEFSGFLRQDSNKWWWTILPYVLQLLIAPLFALYEKNDRMPKMLNMPYTKKKS